jgi:hypothetical protein
MVVHYLTGTGWRFCRWEPITGGDVDVDVELVTSDGRTAYLQVKAPDQPGRVVGDRRKEGEYDERVVKAVAKAASQLPENGTEAKLIVVCANRTQPLSLHPGCLVTELIGSTLQLPSGTVLPRSRLGKFFCSEWKHVSGVVMLDYLRGETRFEYPCTILLNPNADVQAKADWFPRGRVCKLDGSMFRWVRGEPGRYHTLPDATPIVDV